MPSSSTEGRVLRFGVFEADLHSGELRKNGVRIRLPQQSFQILSRLMTCPGEIVTREELRRHLWPADTFVDFDHGVNKSVNKLRDALGDSAVQPRYIETLTRRGYRFIAPVNGHPERNHAAAEHRHEARLVVLPFENLGPDAEDEYFSDGLTEEMISQLGQLSPTRLGVIARTSAMQYKRTTKQIAAIAEELNVDYVLEGSVRKAGSRARITAQLIEARGQSHLWAGSYDRELADVFSVQNEVVSRIARALAVELLPQDGISLGHPATVDPAAHEAYLRGRFAWAQRTESALHSAIRCFEQALEKDPEFALAYVGIADAAVLLPWFGTVSAHECAARAREAAQRAVQIDPNLAEAHSSLALLRFWYQWEWDTADEEFQRAIQLNPNYGTVHNWYCAYLTAMGRFQEAAREQKLAQELDPLSLIIAGAAGHVALYSGNYAEAIEVFRNVITRDPSFLPAHFNLGQACLYSGMYDEAILSLERAARWSGNPGATAALARAYACSGDNSKARSMLPELVCPSPGRCVSPPLIALVHFSLGELETGFDLLEKGFNERSYWMTFLKVDPAYRSVREHPRFRRLVRLMNFEHTASCSAA